MCGFLCHRRIVVLDGLEVQLFKKSKFFGGRHERILHELVKGLKTLHVDPHSVFIALTGSVESITLCKTQAPQIAHGGLNFNVLLLFSISFSLLTVLNPVGAVSGLSAAERNAPGTVRVQWGELPPRSGGTRRAVL